MPRNYKVANCMAWDNTLVQQATAVGAPVGDKSGYGFHGDAVVFGFQSVRSIFVRYPSQRSALACNAFSGLLSRLGRFCNPTVISFSEVKKEMATFTGYLEVWIRAV